MRGLNKNVLIDCLRALGTHKQSDLEGNTVLRMSVYDDWRWREEHIVIDDDEITYWTSQTQRAAEACRVGAGDARAERRAGTRSRGGGAHSARSTRRSAPPHSPTRTATAASRSRPQWWTRKAARRWLARTRVGSRALRWESAAASSRTRRRGVSGAQIPDRHVGTRTSMWAAQSAKPIEISFTLLFF